MASLYLAGLFARVILRLAWIILARDSSSNYFQNYTKNIPFMMLNNEVKKRSGECLKQNSSILFFQTLIVEKQGGDATITAVNVLQNVIIRVSETPQARLKGETPNPWHCHGASRYKGAYVAKERLQRELIPSRTSAADNRFVLISWKQPTKVNPSGTICYNDATFTPSSPPRIRGRQPTGSRTERRVSGWCHRRDFIIQVPAHIVNRGEIFIWNHSKNNNVSPSHADRFSASLSSTSHPSFTFSLFFPPDTK